MKSLRLKMSFDEYDTMEWRFGWKHEYWGGHARLTPRYDSILARVPVEKRFVKFNSDIVSLEKIKIKNLEKLFFDSFVETVEYCDYARSKVRAAAKKNVQKFFDGERGEPILDLSGAVILENQLAGAALIVRKKYGIKLEILFVSPAFQRRGAATALASHALNMLAARSEEYLWSEYRACNEESTVWHANFGFVEEPDLAIAQMRYYFYRHELYRLSKLREIEKIKDVKSLLKKAKFDLERLRRIAATEGFGRAYAMWKYD